MGWKRSDSDSGYCNHKFQYDVLVVIIGLYGFSVKLFMWKPNLVWDETSNFVALNTFDIEGCFVVSCFKSDLFQRLHEGFFLQVEISAVRTHGHLFWIFKPIHLKYYEYNQFQSSNKCFLHYLLHRSQFPFHPATHKNLQNRAQVPCNTDDWVVYLLPDEMTH